MYFIYVIRFFMILVNVIYVIMMKHPISYRELCYLVKRFGIHWSIPNS